MKNTFYILIALLLLMVACGRPSGNAPLSAELQRAEDLMYPHPDSALHILQAMTPPKDELNRATWALLMTQAKYKCNVKQSDSLVNIAYDYFSKKHNIQRIVLALYLKGGIENDNNQYEKALTLFLDAEKKLDKIDEDILGFYICSHIGLIYAYQSLNEYAIDYSNKSYEYALQTQNHKLITAAYVQLARTYSKINIDKSIEYYEKAIDVARKCDDKKQEARILIELSGRYKVHSQKKYLKAKSYVEEALKIRESAQAYLVLGDIYKELGQLDSACHYLNKASSSENIYTTRNAYKSLYNISKESGNYKEAVEYSEKLWNKQDSINKIASNNALIEMQEKYDQQRVRDELTTKMTLQKQRILMGIGVAVLILCFIAYRIRIRNKERITRLAEAEERIETLNHLLEEAQKEPSPDAGQDDTFFKRILLQQLGIIRMVANTPTAQNQALLRRLAETGNDEMPAEELIAWKDLYPIIDRLYDNFYTRLMERFGSVLTDKEVQTCCLLCAGFSTKEIAVITRQTSGTVYVRKSSSRQKMGAPDGADIVEWVKGIGID
ncbi:MAG: hypothetical protein IJZ38_13235 [Bacteroides sp.]|nr:hypothetical protein [Bacteroides sp.]